MLSAQSLQSRFAQTCAEVTWIRVKAYKHCMLTHLSSFFSHSFKAWWSRWPKRSSGTRQPSATSLTIPPCGPPPTPCPRGTKGARWTHWILVTYRRHMSVCLIQSIVQYIQAKLHDPQLVHFHPFPPLIERVYLARLPHPACS